VRDYRAGVLQQAQIRERQAAPVSAREEKGHSGGAGAFSKIGYHKTSLAGSARPDEKMEGNKNVSIVGRGESLEEMSLGGTLPPAEQPEPLLRRHPGRFGGAEQNDL